jgi:hypothetical protein
MGQWIPYKEVDWDNPEFTMFHLDTRDFCVKGNDFNPVINFVRKKAKHRADQFFFTKQELIELLDRYYKESGGPGEWRMFYLSGEGELLTSNWQLKYIRIVRTKYGFVIYDHDAKFVYPKKILNCPVATKHLNHH